MYGPDPKNMEIKSTIKLLEIINISKYCMEYKDKRYAFEINLFHRIKSLSKNKVRGFDRLLILTARNILKNKSHILSQNAKDLKEAEEENLSKNLVDRLMLDSKRIQNTTWFCIILGPTGKRISSDN